MRERSSEADPGSVGRHHTAIRRVRCSRPVALAMAEGVITPSTSVFDYGCGHGGDVRYLTARGVAATGWDPHFAPIHPLQTGGRCESRVCPERDRGSCGAAVNAAQGLRPDKAGPPCLGAAWTTHSTAPWNAVTGS